MSEGTEPSGTRQARVGHDARPATPPTGGCGCGASGCGGGGAAGGVRRRDFLKLAGGGMLATSLGRPAIVMAGPFGAADAGTAHPVPADKKLDPDWVRSLFERGTKEVYSGGDLDGIGMPCGGIGSGQLYVCGDGTLGDWQVFNNARSYWVGETNSTYTHEGIAQPVEQGFTVVTETPDGTRAFASLSREGFKDISFKGEYPIATVTYAENGAPVRVETEVYSPFIPLNARESCLPATIFNITVENATQDSLTVSVLGRLENAVSNEYKTHSAVVGKTRINLTEGRGLVLHASEKPPEAPAAPVEAPREPIVFETFEGEDYGAWSVTGEAFGTGPARGTLPGQQEVSGFEGRGLVNSFLGGDAPAGRLVSPPFTITRKYINVLVGGGSDAKRTCVNLMMGDRIIRSAAGRNEERLAWAVWDVSDCQGKEARIEIVDDASGGWGHINVDQIEFSDTAREPERPALEASRDFGTLALACADALAPEVLEGRIYPAGAPEAYLISGEHAYALKQKRLGLLSSVEVPLAPGAKHRFTFVVAWHFPNQENGHYYAQRFGDAGAVANYALDHHEQLTADTRLWRDTYYDSSLPYWLLDRLHSTLSYLATGTCQWWKNGRFYAYEGVTCCPGTCTHVWNYAHGHARLFPELSRSVREMQDFNPRENGGGFHADTGLVGFRSNDAYAADGQCGTILKAYREHLMSPDGAFLQRNWPRIKLALEYSIGHDGNVDGLIEDEQHNTYDINYHGANTFVGSLYLAALRAGEEMAKEVGDTAFAERAHAIYESGRSLTLKRLWNGEYFVQEVDLEEYPRHQYKDGCLSDHLFGQGWAHQLGLGYIYPRENVRSALQAVWKYNWAPDISMYNEEHPPFRWFISPGQAGLLTCTWPRSAFLAEGTMYKSEVWTGIEYQVAGHLAAEGFVEEALVVCRAVHDRYHPSLKNPYNEVECGDHYARALASWGVYLALAGFEYHGPKGHIGFSPRLSPDAFKAAFTWAEGWGTFEQMRSDRVQTERIGLKWGRLRARTFVFGLQEGALPRSVTVAAAGKPVDASFEVSDGRVLVTLAREATIQQGEAFEIVIA